jgi:lipid A 3-O-deacylase
VLLPSSLLGGVPRQAGPLTLHWDLWVSHWRVPAERGRSGLTQIGGAAIWRHALGGQGAPWFVDLGIGASVMDRLYATPQKRFSTAFQFTEVAAQGFRFGDGQRQEISLRYQHFSNGGIKRPNPRQDIVRVRWAAHF